MNPEATDHIVAATVYVLASSARVWNAIASPVELIQWYAPGCRGEIPELRDGATLRFFNTDTGVQVATIARCVALVELVLRWRPVATRPDTILTNSYSLTPNKQGTSITIAQTGMLRFPRRSAPRGLRQMSRRSLRWRLH
jgi:uncharacterized protein YndB with AHSA1/START domain